MSKVNANLLNKLGDIKTIEYTRTQIDSNYNYRINLMLDVQYNNGWYTTIECGYYNFKAKYGIIRIEKIEKEIKSFQAWLNWIYKNIDELASYSTREVETAKNAAKEILREENKRLQIIDRYRQLKYLLTKDIDPSETSEYCKKLIDEAFELETKYPELTYMY